MEHEQTAPRRHRGRTPLLIAGAAVLGVLAGTVTGYAIQYDREPTPLPPLAQQRMAMPLPVAANEGTSRRSVNANRWDKADEDLVKKLLEAPDGAKDATSGYESADEFAAYFYEHPRGGFPGLISDGVRRIATASWQQGEHDFVEIRLLQFQERSGAESNYKAPFGYMATDKYAGNSGFTLPGVPADFGHGWLFKVSEKPGYVPLRTSRAIVRRGDIVMDVELTNNRGDLSEREIIDLAKRQMERL
ncbi:hypothetical protein [Streptomyces sp. ISL-86]|uniref:hypothetical protein n=1 Tax=Streptomyces sp. ISL-86 TaxID=2819187 RepID=UPI001BEA1572|nr:hypothetical protein [Streptomyces sp. ISL-86]MBT2457923.1 hypothetical protein [Streptomyces sp. ISL-86]